MVEINSLRWWRNPSADRWARGGRLTPPLVPFDLDLLLVGVPHVIESNGVSFMSNGIGFMSNGLDLLT